MNFLISILTIIIIHINAFSIPPDYIYNCKHFKNYKKTRASVLVNCIHENNVNTNIENFDNIKSDLVVKSGIRDSSIIEDNIIYNKAEYYNDPRIHNMGNTGIGGWLHAQFALYATKMIDNIRYDGIDIRKLIVDKYTTYYKNKYNKCPKIIDLCCGIGISTVPNQTGIDTSIQMINKAKSVRNSKNYHLRCGRKLFTKYKIGNAENYGKYKEFDCATIMFSLHEMPESAHKKIIKNCFRISRDNVLFVDISPNYNPSKIMLSGEPYLLDYLANFDKLMKSFGFQYVEIVPNHVRVWFYNF